MKKEKKEKVEKSIKEKKSVENTEIVMTDKKGKEIKMVVPADSVDKDSESAHAGIYRMG